MIPLIETADRTSLFYECKKVGVEAILLGSEQAMRRPFIHFELAAWYRLRGLSSGQDKGRALVRIPADELQSERNEAKR